VEGERRQPDLAVLQHEAIAAGRRCCAGAVIFDGEGRLFAPRRAPGAAMPGLWDIVGGHVEDGEPVLDGLRREVFEETGWTVAGEPDLVFVSDWSLPGDPVGRREFDFVVPVAGDLDAPRLAPDEHDEFRWLAPDDVLELFDSNAGADQGLLRRAAEAALSVRPRSSPAAPHATVFVETVASALTGARERWDPVMASLIDPHVTVAYPAEVGDLEEMTRRVTAAAAATEPFRLRLGATTHDGDPGRGIFLSVEDPDAGWTALRRTIAGSDAPVVPPHVTLVHPRTSGLGATAWPELAEIDLAHEVTVTSIAVTAFTDGHWATTARADLG
jgi:8-oxo-dGTP pyrophosphatase MutT (NUDIX family)